MPRNASNVYSKPAGTTFTPSTVIESGKVNEVIDDIVADLNIARPITAGGTGATTASGALSNLGAEVASSYMSKSANYTALTTDKNAFIRFSAAATLSLPAIAGISSGWHVTVFADGYEVTIDPNGTETIDGATTAIVPINETVQIVFDGSEFKMLDETPDEIIASKSGNYTALHTDHRTTLRFTASATLTLTAAATLGANWYCEVWATSGAVTIDPDGTETINAATTLVVRTGQRAKVFCTGTAFFAFLTSDAYSGPQLQGYLYGLALTNNSSDALNDVDFAAGACAADTSPFYLMELSALTKRLDATWAVGNNQGMLDTGSVTNTTYYLYAIQRSDTLVTDFLASTSASSPTMPTNYDRKRLIGSLVRSGGVNGVPVTTGVSSGRKLISSTEIASAVSAIDLTAFDSSKYMGYEIYLSEVTLSTATCILGYTSGNSGTTWDNAANSYDTTGMLRIATTWNGSGGLGTSMFMTAQGADQPSATSGYASVSGKLEIITPEKLQPTKIKIDLEYFRSHDRRLSEFDATAARLSNTAVNGFRLTPASGNFTSGTVYFFGIPKV